MKKAIVSTINSTLTFDEIKKALKNESGIVAQMCENSGFASDKLTVKDFNSKEEFSNWKKSINDIRVYSYSLVTLRKDGRLTSDATNKVYGLLKDLFHTFEIKCKLDSKTCEYLVSKAVKTSTGKSADVLKCEAEIRDYKKQERDAKRPDMFKKQIEELREQIKAMKSVSCNAVKVDTVVSESVYRKTVEDYIAHRVMGIETMTI